MKVFLIYDDTNNARAAKDNIAGDFKKNLNRHDIDVKLVPIRLLKVFLKVDDLFLYPVELNKNLQDSIADLADTTLQILRTFHIPVLLLEHYDIKLDHDQLFHALPGNLDGIDFYLISGNLKFPKEKYSENCPIKLKKIYIVNYWESTTRIIGNSLPEYRKINYEHIIVENKHKDFLCVNRNLRSHRLALISEFLRHDLFKNSNYSILGNDSYLINHRMIKDARDMLTPQGVIHLLELVKNIKVKYLDVTDGFRTDPFRTQFTPYDETFFSLITETEIRSDVLFISEKTFKAIGYFHPFMIFGSPGLLNWLRTQGYQTFPEMFDESYDEELDTSKRLSMLINQVERFKNLNIEQKKTKFYSIVPKLVHNRDLFWNRPNIFKKEINDIFSDIYQNWRSVGESNS